jgi:hypothetical protein
MLDRVAVLLDGVAVLRERAAILQVTIARMWLALRQRPRVAPPQIAVLRERCPALRQWLTAL